MTTDDRYEVLAVRYGTRQASAREVFLNYHSYGEPDRPLGMDYFFWIIRNKARTVVVDTGFSAAGGAARNRTTLLSTAAALAAARVDLGAVGQVAATHAHYDHIGGLPAFGAAEVIMTEPEYDFWTGPMAGPAAIRLAQEGVRVVVADLDVDAARQVAGSLATESAGTGGPTDGSDEMTMAGHVLRTTSRRPDDNAAQGGRPPTPRATCRQHDRG